MRSLFSIILLTAVLILSAQRPFINNLDKTTGTPNELVTITGTGFSSPSVYFGNARATIDNSSSTVIQAFVPAHATFGPISVINGDGTLAISSQLFSLSFDNDFTMGSVTTLPTNQSVISGSGATSPYDICLCDFDNDNDLDAVITNDETGNFTIATNQSPGSPVFTLSNSPIAEGNTTLNVECGDLNGDGLADLVMTTRAARFVHVYQNTSTGGVISFAKVTRIEAPDYNGEVRQIRKVRIADIDGDGLRDIVVGNTNPGDNNLLVYLNSSGNVFPTNPSPVLVGVPEAEHTGSFNVGDLDGDGKQDLVVIPYAVSSERVYLLQNTSIPGNVQFTYKGFVGSSAERENIVVADFNGDGRNDIASALLAGSAIEVLRNDGGFSFTQDYRNGLSGSVPFGIDVGDINGDGKPDVVVGSLADQVIYYENNSTGNDIDFSTPIQRNTGKIVRNLKVGDVTLDGKPDIVFVNNSTSGFPTEIGYIVNESCMTPVIEPSSGTYCNGTEFIIRATAGEGISYLWNIPGGSPSSVGPTSSNELDISNQNVTLSNITVTATAADGCSVESAGITINSGSASVAIAPTLNDPGVICIGTDLTLSSPTSATNYHWYGPDGFISTTTTGSLQINASATLSNSGDYFLIVDNGDCLSPESSVMNVVVSQPPSTTISATVCTTSSTTLEIPNNLGSGLSYQWTLNGENVGTNTTSFDATNPGSYAVTITNGDNCSITTEDFQLYNSSFTADVVANTVTLQEIADAPLCQDLQIDFISDQTGGTNTWEIEDPVGTIIQTSTGGTLSYTFTTPGIKLIRLVSAYTDGLGCVERTFDVVTPSNFSIESSITASSGVVSKCPTETVTFSLTDASVDSIVWKLDGVELMSDDPLNPKSDITLSDAGDYTATYYSTSGCETTTSVLSIQNFPGLGLTVSNGSLDTDEKYSLNSGEVEAQLQIDASATNVSWTVDGETGFSTENSISTFIDKPEIVISVTATTSDGCVETEELIVKSNLTPRQFFSPNGDGENDCWQIINSQNLDGCSVIILDQRGAKVFEGASPFNELGEEDCVWKGDFNGKQVAEGIYYYILKCSNSDLSRTGSIILSR